ncbi:MAG: hypothetical protein HY816_20015 [Candidatus Wallbacteria bacterium]|nr:hypothetical protein [Candidatus Wallbacteria bacterium]
MGLTVTLASLDAAWLKGSHIFGIPLTAADGSTMGDPALQYAIDVATATLGRELGLALKPTRVLTRPDPGKVLGTDYDEDGQPLTLHFRNGTILVEVRLPHNNIISIQRLRGFVADQECFNFPTEWIVLRKREGWFSFVPTTGAMIPILNSGNPNVPLLVMAMRRASSLPGFWAVDYTHGLPGDTALPIDLADWIGKTAAISVLSILGSSQLLGQNSRSISIDGISDSRSFSGAQAGRYGDRIDRFQKELDKIDIKKLRRYFHGLKVFEV